MNSLLFESKELKDYRRKLHKNKFEDLREKFKEIAFEEKQIKQDIKSKLSRFLRRIQTSHY